VAGRSHETVSLLKTHNSRVTCESHCYLVLSVWCTSTWSNTGWPTGTWHLLNRRYSVGWQGGGEVVGILFLWVGHFKWGLGLLSTACLCTYNGSHFPFRRRTMVPSPSQTFNVWFFLWWYLKSGVYAHNPRLGSFIQPFCLYVLCSYLSLYILTQFLSPLFPLFSPFVCSPAVHNTLNVSLNLFLLYLLYRDTFPSTQPLNKGFLKIC